MDTDAAKKPVALLILDGWGLSPTWRGNALATGHIPHFEKLWREYPHIVLQTVTPDNVDTGETIGSDVTHAMIGSGRQLTSDLHEINRAIKDGSFAANPVLQQGLAAASTANSAIHLLGLASDGGVHSNLTILRELLLMAHAQHLTRVYLHLITDGIDTPSQSGQKFVQSVQKMCDEIGVGAISSIIGRYFAMDRSNHWERSLRAQALWTRGKGQKYHDYQQLFVDSYRQNIPDSLIPPTLLGPTRHDQLIHAGDVVICWNARSDRLGQLIRIFLDQRAPGGGLFATRRGRLGQFISLISPRLPEEKNLALIVAFPPARIRGTLGEIIVGRNLRQLRITESEKAGHLRSFFDGGRVDALPNAEHWIVESPNVRTPDLRPAMATPRVLERATHALTTNKADLYIINFGNVDLVAHTGNFAATVEAAHIADQALGHLAETVLAAHGRLLITADHGNAERLVGSISNHQTHRHTTNPVPFLLVEAGRERNFIQQAITTPAAHLGDIVRSKASLADIAPTILDLFSIPTPVEMTGQSLLSRLQ